MQNTMAPYKAATPTNHKNSKSQGLNSFLKQRYSQEGQRKSMPDVRKTFNHTST